MQANVWEEFVGKSVAVQFKQSLMLCRAGESGTTGAPTPGPVEVPTPDGPMPLQMPMLLDVTLTSIKDGIFMFRMNSVDKDGSELEIAIVRDMIFAITRVSKAPSLIASA